MNLFIFINLISSATSVYAYNKCSIILVEVYELHIVILVFLYPLLHLLFNLCLILLILFSIMRKVEEGQFALLILPVRLCDINRVLAD